MKEYDYVGIDHNGMRLVAINGIFGYIDELGREIIPLKFTKAYNFNDNGLARIGVGRIQGYINKEGQIVSYLP